MFYKIVISVILMLSTIVVYAGNTTLDTSGLTESQVAELKAHTAKVVADAAKQADGSLTASTSTLSMAATWGQQASQAAEGFAKALGIAARELGVTVNDFLHTDAGKITAVLIIWKVMGGAALKIIYGTIFVTVGLSIVRAIYLRLFTKGYEKVEYSYFGGLFKGTKMIRITKGFQDLSNDGEWLAFWLMLGLSLGVMIAGGAFFA